ncbi:hypothetical protein VTJ49DRAFT_411 [Mycothermus thermophilus]|uniref:F-box domain-containing protein n=1 Tax=Humicola insolens TaxID=85995 RepID=A0ABR3VGS6_HUMIN
MAAHLEPRTAAQPLRLTDLPDDILFEIFEYFVPPSRRYQYGSFPSGAAEPVQPDYKTGHTDLQKLRDVCRRFKHFVDPILYRHFVISGPRSLCKLLDKLFREPYLRGMIRHISIAFPLYGSNRYLWEAASASGKLLSAGTSGPVADPTQLDPPAQQLHQLLSSSRTHTLFDMRAIYAVICLATGLETLHILYNDQVDYASNFAGGSTPAWRWFVSPYTLRPSKHGGHRFPPGLFLGTLAQGKSSSSSSLWPPPSLRRIVAEYGPFDGGGNFFVMSTTSSPKTLTTTAKHLTTHLADFLHTTTPLLTSPDVSHTSSITIYVPHHSQPDPTSQPSGPPPRWSRLQADMQDSHARTAELAEPDSPESYNLMMNDAARPDRLGASLRLLAESVGEELQAVHLPLKGMNAMVSWWAYGPKWRVVGLRGLTGVKEVTVTLEGFLGRADWYAWMVLPWYPWQGSGFLREFPEPGREEGGMMALDEMFGKLILGQTTGGGGKGDGKEEEEEEEEEKPVDRERQREALMEIVEDLPPRIERLNLIEWFCQYASEAALNSVGLQPLSEFARLGWQVMAVSALKALVGPLAEARPTLKKVEMRWHASWNGSGLIKALLGDEKAFLDSIVREYQEKGITLEFRD